MAKSFNNYPSTARKRAQAALRQREDEYQLWNPGRLAACYANFAKQKVDHVNY